MKWNPPRVTNFLIYLNATAAGSSILAQQTKRHLIFETTTKKKNETQNHWLYLDALLVQVHYSK